MPDTTPPRALVEDDISSTEEEGKYVYCIIKTEDDHDFSSIGIGGEANRVYTVHHRDLAAVVSDTPIRIYDPTRENVLAHELVNETVMREYTVIPMSFGTIFRTRDDIVELLKSTYRAFDDVLAGLFAGQGGRSRNGLVEDGPAPLHVREEGRVWSGYWRKAG